MARVIVDKALYREGQRESCGDLSDELERMRASGSRHDFLWIGLKDPSMQELEEVNAELGLGLHQLALEDAVSGRQRAKIELYGQDVFVRPKTLSYIEETSDVETGEIMVHISEPSSHHPKGRAAPLAGCARMSRRTRQLALGPMSALHAIIDNPSTSTSRSSVELARDIDEIEADVFSDGLVRRMSSTGSTRGPRGAPRHHPDDRAPADAAHERALPGPPRRAAAALP